MEPFKTTRNRDAWAAIRGFFYQAELIIDRWLELPDGHAIEVERGEDIDIVASAVRGQEAHRFLEQVKFREAKITLMVAAPALASFHEHWATNGGINLTFRYVTNAQIARERISVFPNREPGLQAWERLRLRQIDPKDQEAVLRGIRATLRSSIKPSDTNEVTWKGFQDFLTASSDDELLGFVTAVEWSTQNPAPEALQGTIESRLLQAGYCHTPTGATELYQRLFLFVFRLLSQRGIKRITASDRNSEISRQLLSDEDHALLKSLEWQMSNAHARLTDVEDFLKLFKDRMTQLAVPQTANTAVRYGTAPVNLDVPLAVEHCVARKYRVTRYRERFNSKTWCAIYGDIGSGKTHLAIQVAQEDWSEVIWLRFRDKDQLSSSQYLYSVLGEIGGSTSFSWRTTCRAALSRLSGISLIVLDDLPLTSGTDALDEQLTALGDECHRAGVKIFSTSPHRLSAGVSQALSTKLLQEEVPSFSDKEIVELLSVHGAPAHVLNEKFASGFGLLTKKHPALLTAGIRYMAARGWAWDEEAFAGLLSGAYAWEAKANTRRLLTATVSDSETRELLNRLSLASSSFGQSDIVAAASAAPTISRPLERLSTASGLWIQQDSSDTFTLSPLISHLGANDLSDDTKTETHLALGRSLTQKHVLGPIELSRAVVHFASGGEHNTAGKILLRGLQAFIESDTAKNDYGLSDYWYDMPLPTEMAPDLQLYVRLMQVQVRFRLGKDFAAALADIDRLFASSLVNDSVAPMAVAVLIASECGDTIPYQKLISLFNKAMELWPGTHVPDDLANLHPEWMLWIQGTRIQGGNDMRSWLEAVSNLTPMQRQNFLSSPLCCEGSVAVSEAVWRHEYDKTIAYRNWATVCDEYEQAADRANAMGLDLLWGCFVRAQITVKSEFLHELPGAVALANVTLLSTSTPDICLLVTECMGRQYVYSNDHSAALPWLAKAVHYSTDRFAFLSARALLYMSQLVGETDGLAAVRYSEQASMLALEARNRGASPQDHPLIEIAPAIDDEFVVKALMEHAIAAWLSGNLAGAFEPIESAIEILWGARSEDDEWKALFVICAHISGYLTSLVSTLQPPAQTLSGEPYVAPARGMMFRYSAMACQAYATERDYAVLVHMATFASNVGADDRATVWAEKALDRIRSVGNLSALPIICGEIIGQMVKAAHFTEALEVALQASAVTTALRKAADANRQPLLSGLDVDTVLGAKPSTEWIEAEQWGAKLALIPIMLELLRRDLRDSAESKVLAEQVAKACELLKEVASDAALWQECAELFRWFFNDRPRARALWQRAARQVDSVAHALCYLAVSISSPPADAMAAQLAVIPSLGTLLSHLQYLDRNVVTPFLHDYWRACFNQKRVHFGTPSLVQSALEQACASPLQDRGKRIVSAVLFGLNVTISDVARAWLQPN